MGLHPLLDSNSLAVTAKQHDSTYSSISAIIVCNTGILFSFSSVSVPHKHDLWPDFVALSTADPPTMDLRAFSKEFSLDAATAGVPVPRYRYNTRSSI